MATKIYFINSSEAQYTDDEFAWFQTLMFNEGIIGDPDSGNLGLLVTQNAVPDMSVLVEAGKALIEVVISGRTLKVVAENTASEQLAIAANSSGSNRVDAVIFRVDKDTQPNETKSNVATLEVITGSGTSPLSNAAISTAVGNDGWVRIANIEIPNAASSIIDSYITDVRSIVTFSNGFSFGSIFSVTSEADKVPLLNGSGKLDPSLTTKPNVVVMDDVSENVSFGGADTQYNVTDQGGGTFRYTWNGNGTNPNISAANFPAGKVVMIVDTSLVSGNEGAFVITASSTNYFEVTNTNGVEQTSITQAGGHVSVGAAANIYSKPANLKYVVVESVSGGGGGQGGEDSTSGTDSGGAGGGGGGYTKDIIDAVNLPTDWAIYIGKRGNAGTNNNGAGGEGEDTVVAQNFHIRGGIGGATNGGSGGVVVLGGAISINGGDGHMKGGADGATAGNGGNSPLGFGGGSTNNGNGRAGTGYGSGGGGGDVTSDNGGIGGVGTQGVVIITEYFN